MLYKYITMHGANTYKKNFFPLEIGTSTNSNFLHKGKETKYYTVTLHKPVVTTEVCVQDRKRIPFLSRKLYSAKYCYTCAVIIRRIHIYCGISLRTDTKTLHKLVSTVTCHVSIICIVEWLWHRSSGEAQSVRTRSYLVLAATKIKLRVNSNFVGSRNDSSRMHWVSWSGVYISCSVHLTCIKCSLTVGVGVVICVRPYAWSPKLLAVFLWNYLLGYDMKVVGDPG
jgi:hypothetical protein